MIFLVTTWHYLNLNVYVTAFWIPKRGRRWPLSWGLRWSACGSPDPKWKPGPFLSTKHRRTKSGPVFGGRIALIVLSQKKPLRCGTILSLLLVMWPTNLTLMIRHIGTIHPPYLTQVNTARNQPPRLKKLKKKPRTPVHRPKTRAAPQSLWSSIKKKTCFTVNNDLFSCIHN